MNSFDRLTNLEFEATNNYRDIVWDSNPSAIARKPI